MKHLPANEIIIQIFRSNQKPEAINSKSQKYLRPDTLRVHQAFSKFEHESIHRIDIRQVIDRLGITPKQLFDAIQDMIDNYYIIAEPIDGYENNAYRLYQNRCIVSGEAPDWSMYKDNKSHIRIVNSPYENAKVF